MEKLKELIKEKWYEHFEGKIENCTDNRKRNGLETRRYNLINKDIDKINAIKNASDDLRNELVITVNWRKSRTWGNNPTATDNFGNSSGSIGGCGYDKCSTAIAKILNMHHTILKKMYEIKNDRFYRSNADLFGYGSGYGILPYFEGGVGVNCYPPILEKLGYEAKVFQTLGNTVMIIRQKDM